VGSHASSRAGGSMARSGKTTDTERTDGQLVNALPDEPAATSGASGDAGIGDDNPELTQEEREEAHAVALSLIDAAAAAEPAISDVVSAAISAVEAEQRRFATRLKEARSVYRKVQGIMVEDETSADDAGFEINDALRYTAVIDQSDYWARGDAIVEALGRAGYESSRPCRGWKTIGYRGRNESFRGSDGLEFEVQMHTSQSLAAAEETREMYEIERMTTTPDDEKAKLRAKINAIYAEVPAPDDVRWL
jgi:hypothetical protein